MTDKKAEIEGSPSKAYRFFETFPLPWKAPTRVAKALQILVVASLVTVGFAFGLGMSHAECMSRMPPPPPPKEPSPPQPPPAMCFDKILTRPNDVHDSSKCPFWDQKLQIATLKGEGVVICKCPGSKSEP